MATIAFRFRFVPGVFSFLYVYLVWTPFPEVPGHPSAGREKVLLQAA